MPVPYVGYNSSVAAANAFALLLRVRVADNISRTTIQTVSSPYSLSSFFFLPPLHTLPISSCAFLFPFPIIGGNETEVEKKGAGGKEVPSPFLNSSDIHGSAGNAIKRQPL